MTPAVQSQPASPPAKKPRRRRLILLTILVLLVALPTAMYFMVKWMAAREFESVVAETDRLDPDWRIDTIEAKREVLRPEENSAVQIAKVLTLSGRNGLFAGRWQEASDLFDHLEAPHELNPQQLELLREAIDAKLDAMKEARKLKDMPKGRHPLKLSPDFISTLLNDQQNSRQVLEMLKYDAMLHAHLGDLDAAIESCRAGMNGARSLGDEPLLISFLIRVAGDHIAIFALERALAQGRPPAAALKPMQELLEQEISDAHKHWINAMRGERGGQEKLMKSLNDGKVKMSWFMGPGIRGGAASPLDYLSDYFPILLTRSYPALLRHMNEAVEVSKLPTEQQAERAREYSDRIKTGPYLVRLIAPAIEKVTHAHIRNQALLRSAQLAVAAERFRIDHERWPDSVAELQKVGLIAQAPRDPFDGAPLRMKRGPENLLFYGVGLDRTDDGGNINIHKSHEAGVDVGFRLWDLDRRRQPPRPAVDPNNGP